MYSSVCNNLMKYNIQPLLRLYNIVWPYLLVLIHSQAISSCGHPQSKHASQITTYLPNPGVDFCVYGLFYPTLKAAILQLRGGECGHIRHMTFITTLHHDSFKTHFLCFFKVLKESVYSISFCYIVLLFGSYHVHCHDLGLNPSFKTPLFYDLFSQVF